MDADGSNAGEVAGGSGWDFNPAWSPDGGRIAFQSEADGGSEIYVMDVETWERARLTDNGHFDGSPAGLPTAARYSSIPTGTIEAGTATLRYTL